MTRGAQAAAQGRELLVVVPVMALVVSGEQKQDNSIVRCDILTRCYLCHYCCTSFHKPTMNLRTTAQTMAYAA